MIPPANTLMVYRAILAFLALPTLVAGVFPWAISMSPGPTLIRTSFGMVFFVIGGSILIVSVVTFYRRGRGTLAPWDPPKNLVVHDLYRFTRNPMYVGVTTVLVGWALTTGNLWNYVYAAAIPLIFHISVVFYEEKEMERLFRHDWERYRAWVPRWGFRLRPFDPEGPNDSAG